MECSKHNIVASRVFFYIISRSFLNLQDIEKDHCSILQEEVTGCQYESNICWNNEVQWSIRMLPSVKADWSKQIHLCHLFISATWWGVAMV